MKKTHYLLGFALMLSLVGFSGCTQPKPQKPPEQVLKEGVQKLMATHNYQFDVDMKADMALPSSSMDEAVAPKPDKVNFDLHFKGGIDLKNAQNPQVNLKTDLSGNALAMVFLGVTPNEQPTLASHEGSASLEARFNKDTLYFNLAQLVIAEGQDANLPKELKDFTDKYVGKWWKVVLPPAVMKEFSKTIASVNDGATMTPEQKKTKRLIEQTNFFKDISYVGTEDVKGEQSYHYHAVLNKEAVVDFLVKLASLEGTEISIDTKKEISDGLKNLDFSGDFWVGKDSGTLDQVHGNIKFIGEKTDPKLTLVIKATMWDFNKPITVEIPKDAQAFPEDQLPPGFGMNGGEIDQAMTEANSQEIVSGSSSEEKATETEEVSTSNSQKAN